MLKVTYRLLKQLYYHTTGSNHTSNQYKSVQSTL